LTAGKIAPIIWLRLDVEIRVPLEVVAVLERTGVSRIFGIAEVPLKRMEMPKKGGIITTTSPITSKIYPTIL
jgi:hypothetical protein